MAINKQIHFDDLSAFWDFSMQESNAYRKSSRDDNLLQWSGGLTWDQAKRLALSGWLDILNEIEKYRAKVFLIIAKKVLRPQQVYSLAGYCVDVGSFLSNQPECFIAREYEERNYPGRIYKIISSISFSAAISPQTIIQRGAMICALIDAIEFAGHRTEVICNAAMSAGHTEEHLQGKRKEQGWLEFSVTVKKTSQPLEMSDLAFCLAHPAMLRRMIFSAAELQGWSDSFSNYGYPSAATDKGDLYLKEVFSGTVPDDEAIDWVLKELEQLGVKIENT